MPADVGHNWSPTATTVKLSQQRCTSTRRMRSSRPFFPTCTILQQWIPQQRDKMNPQQMDCKNLLLIPTNLDLGLGLGGGFKFQVSCFVIVSSTLLSRTIPVESSLPNGHCGFVDNVYFRQMPNISTVSVCASRTPLWLRCRQF